MNAGLLIFLVHIAYKKCKLVMRLIGTQGFVLGSGNLQLIPGVIRAIGLQNIMVIASRVLLRISRACALARSRVAGAGCVSGAGTSPAKAGRM